MSLGTRLYDLRRSKHLSQEDVADKLNVTRQTISKWETDQSTPDFDKIAPLCELYDITTDELLTGNKEEKEEKVLSPKDNRAKRANGIAAGVLGYFAAIAWIMISIPVLMINPVAASAIFIFIIGVATSIIIYTCITYKKEKVKEDEPKNTLRKQIEEILSLITLVVYLLVSFLTMAWHITWIIWIIYALACAILKLIFILKGETDEE